MKTTYRFTDKDLGNLFMSRLEEMGYDRGIDNTTRCIINAISGDKNTAWFNHLDRFAFEPDKTFQLESQWNESLEHARKQLSAEPVNKFFDWDVKKVGGRVYIGCADYTTSFLSGLKDALRHVKDKTVQEVLGELDKL